MSFLFIIYSSHKPLSHFIGKKYFNTLKEISRVHIIKMNHKLEIKHCDYDLISSAFLNMILNVKLVEVSKIIDSFIMIGLDCTVSIKHQAIVHIPLRNVSSIEFDQIKNTLHKEGVKYAIFN